MVGSATEANRSFPRLLRPALLLFFLVLEGCATAGSDNPFLESRSMGVFSLRVESRNMYDVSVYVIPAGRRQLVGTIRANGMEFFEFEYPLGMPLSVELETEIGDRYRIPTAPFFGGGRVDLFVSNDLRRSGFRR